MCVVFFQFQKKIQKTLHTTKFHSKILCHSKTEKIKESIKREKWTTEKESIKENLTKNKINYRKLEVSIDLLGFFSFGTRFCLVLELGYFFFTILGFLIRIRWMFWNDFSIVGFYYWDNKFTDFRGKKTSQSTPH